jgi:hypothetical protein
MIELYRRTEQLIQIQDSHLHGQRCRYDNEVRITGPTESVFAVVEEAEG